MGSSSSSSSGSSTKVTWQSGPSVCSSQGPNYNFSVPVNVRQNLDLQVSASAQGYSYVWIDMSDQATSGCWVPHNYTCPYGPDSSGLTPAQRIAVITVSVVGGIIVLLLGAIFVAFKYSESRRYLRLRKFEQKLKVRRKAKFVAVPA